MTPTPDNKATCADDNVKQCDVKQRDQQSDDMSCHGVTHTEICTFYVKYFTLYSIPMMTRCRVVYRILPTDTKETNDNTKLLFNSNTKPDNFNVDKNTLRACS